MQVYAVGAVPDEIQRAFEARVGGHRALRQALAAGLLIRESVPMDEFTRDVLLGPEGGYWLAYDTT